MEQSEKISGYLNEVCAHVRWKQAHEPIRSELSTHIEDERQGFMEQGLDEANAVEYAVKEMGDPAEVGARFDAAYRPQKNWSVWIPFAVLLLVGFAVRTYINGGIALSAYTPLMIAAFVGAFFFPAGRLAKWAWVLYAAYCAAFILLMIARPVYSLGRLSYDWAPYLFLFLPVLYALLIYRMRGRGIGGIIPLGACFAVPALLALVMPSTALVTFLSFVCLALLLYALSAGWFSCRKLVAALVILAPALLAIALVLLLASDYRVASLHAIFVPEIDPNGTGYFGVVIKDILAQSNFIGALDPSRLSERAHNFLLSGGNVQELFLTRNFMLIWLSARLGSIVFVLVVAALAAFTFCAARICLKQRSMLGRLISLSIVLTVAAQCAGYIAGNLGIALFLLYPLPFIASGDAAMLCNLMLAGLLFSTFRTGMLLEDSIYKKQARWKIKLSLVKERSG